MFIYVTSILFYFLDEISDAFINCLLGLTCSPAPTCLEAIPQTFNQF